MLLSGFAGTNEANRVSGALIERGLDDAASPAYQRDWWSSSLIEWAAEGGLSLEWRDTLAREVNTPNEQGTAYDNDSEVIPPIPLVLQAWVKPTEEKIKSDPMCLLHVECGSYLIT